MFRFSVFLAVMIVVFLFGIHAKKVNRDRAHDRARLEEMLKHLGPIKTDAIRTDKITAGAIVYIVDGEVTTPKIKSDEVTIYTGPPYACFGTDEDRKDHD